MRQRTTTPTWTRSERGIRLRVLIESADPALAVSDFGAFTAAGMDVAVCHGPERTAAECPLVRDEPCRLYAGADVVLFDRGSPASELFEAARRRHPATPVVVRGGGAEGAPEGCESLPAGASVEGQISALRRAADRA